jgi:Protein of unknown function (DUF3616)
MVPMRSRAHLFALTVLASLSTVWLPGDATAQNERVWSVKGKLMGKDNAKSVDVSGIACTSRTGFPRSCLVIDDNVQSGQLVTVKDRQIVAGKSIPLIDDRFEGKRLELDGEGVAYSDGFYYVMGSHGHPRDTEGHLDLVRDAAKIRAKIAAASQLIRLRVDPATGRPLTAIGPTSEVPELVRTTKLRGLIMADPTLAPFADKRLEVNGVTIEGIAIQGDRLLAGFRGPVVNDERAAILSVSLPALFEDGAPDPKLHLLPLGRGRGVRDLAPFADGLLVLAGPMAHTSDGHYSVYWWDGAGDTPRLLKDLARYTEGSMILKPEAILPLDQTITGLRVLILFDGAKEGGPRAIEVAKP